jgi:hypothetical protein
LGVVVGGPNTTYQSFQTKINPGVTSMDPQAFRIHGISLESCTGMPTLAAGLEMVATFLRECCPDTTRRVLTTYNGHSFDLPVIFHHLIRDGVDARKCLDKLRFNYTLDVLLLSEGLPGRYKPPVFLTCGKLSTDPSKYPLGKLYTILYPAASRTAPCASGSPTTSSSNLLDGAHDAEVDCKILLAICRHPAVNDLIRDVLPSAEVRIADSKSCCDFTVWTRRFMSNRKVTNSTLMKLPRRRTRRAFEAE